MGQSIFESQKTVKSKFVETSQINQSKFNENIISKINNFDFEDIMNTPWYINADTKVNTVPLQRTFYDYKKHDKTFSIRDISGDYFIISDTYNAKIDSPKSYFAKDSKYTIIDYLTKMIPNI